VVQWDWEGKWRGYQQREKDQSTLFIFVWRLHKETHQILFLFYLFYFFRGWKDFICREFSWREEKRRERLHIGECRGTRKPVIPQNTVFKRDATEGSEERNTMEV
jgi:hypothetical protein